MNKIFSLALLCSAALSFTACVNEEDNLFDKSAAERLNEASALYSKRLTASPNGWALQLYPTKQDEAPYGNGYLLLLRFHENKTVDAAMLNSLSNDYLMSSTSTWNVITDNGPVLSFDTYNNVVHTFSDPEDVPSTGTQDNKVDETGTGIGGDYEFIIVDAPEDASYMMLKGKKRGTYNLMTPVEEGVDYESYLYGVREFQKEFFSNSALYADTLHAGDLKYKFEDANEGMPSIYEWHADKVTSEEFNPFLITKRGNDFYLRFRDSKLYGEHYVQELKWNQEKDIFEDENDDAVYLEGPDPCYVFDSLLVKDTRKWVIDDAVEMSGQFQTLYSKVGTQMKSMNVTLANITFNRSSSDLMISFNCKRPKQANVSVDYVVKMTKGNGTETFAYVSTKNGATMMERVPAIKEFLDFMGQTFTVTASTTRFNLQTVKLTSVANADDKTEIRLN